MTHYPVIENSKRLPSSHTVSKKATTDKTYKAPWRLKKAVSL